MKDEPETLLGEDDGLVFRRFFEWGVGHGFDLGIVQMTTPWKRDALLAWAVATVPGVQVIALDDVGPGKRRLWDVLRDATAPEKNTTALIFSGLEEAEAQERIVAQLNVERDELKRGFSLPWLMLVHPTVAQVMERRAPDFVDFAGAWMWEEAPSLRKLELGAIDDSPAIVAPMPVAAMAAEKDLLGKATRAIDRGRLDEASDLLAQFDMRIPEAWGDDPDRISIAARLFAARGQLLEARVACEAACERYEKRADVRGRAGVLLVLANIEERQGLYERARSLAEESMYAFDAMGDRAGQVIARQLLARVEERKGRDDVARLILERTIVSFDKSGNNEDKAASQLQLAFIAERHGHHEEAQKLLEEARPTLEKMGDLNGIAACLTLLARIAERQGRTEEARQLLAESASTTEKSGNVPGRAASLHELAVLDASQGELAQAQKLLGEAIAIKERIGEPRGLAASQIVLGQIEVQQGRFNIGRRLVEIAVVTLEAIGSGHVDQARAILRSIDALQAPPLQVPPLHHPPSPS